MEVFRINKCEDRNKFSIVYNKCGKEARIIPRIFIRIMIIKIPKLY